MDFKEGSFWHTIIPFDKNVSYAAANLSISDDVLTGTVDEVATGYRAIEKREYYHNNSDSNYIFEKNEEIQEMEIVDFLVENAREIDQPFKEKYAIEYNPELIADKVYINPFFLQKELTENPFTSDDRSFPVNLGYPFSNTYMMTINLNNSYEVEQLPTNKVIEFAGGTGQCKIIFANTNGKVSLRFAFKLTDSHFVVEDYVNLKEFFNQVADVLNDEVIVLRKL